MAATDNLLFKIDAILLDGKPIAFEDGSGELEGAAGRENEVVASASGDDFEKTKRIPRTFKCKIQFGPSVNPEDYAGLRGVQISAQDSQSRRRVLLNKCSFAKMGAIGGGPVDVMFNVLAAPQWL